MSATTTLYDHITATIAASGVAYRIHEHAPSVTIQDADTYLDFPVEQLLKTIAFRVKNRAQNVPGSWPPFVAMRRSTISGWLPPWASAVTS